METEHALRAFLALSSRARLDVLRLLVRRAGRIGGVRDPCAHQLSPTNSFHLKALMQAGLLAVQAEGLSALSRRPGSLAGAE
ncbi:MAG: hypothetical protein R3F04_05010 [Lysobacteraceae bacterium]